MKPMHRTVLLALATLTPLVAQAHPGHDSQSGLLMGVMHPFTGWDHLAVLLCLGVLAAGRGARLAMGAGMALMAALAGGAALGLAFPEATFVEPAIMATVIASLALLFLRVRVGRGALLALCLAFTLVHGMAHGQEAPASQIAAYFMGFTLAGAAIFAGGIVLAQVVMGRCLGNRVMLPRQ